MSGSDLENDWNGELEAEVKAEDVGSLVVYSRDWTVETILSQIDKKNINLNPRFQRRNAWNDSKRSKLIESLIIGVPVPEIVLAEDKDRKRSFIVIDGKQRLLALAGFINSKEYPSWSAAKLKGLVTRSDLNGKSFEDLSQGESESADKTELMNSDIRCTVISNYKSVQILYDIFYRLNSGSVPLSSQELRQALNRGDFADYLIEVTNEIKPIHKVMNLSEPDSRLRDAEILLRYIAFSMFGAEYTGNLTPFLDAEMAKINNQWDTLSTEVVRITDEFHIGTETLLESMPEKKVGRKITNKGWETRFNRVLFEVQVYYASRVNKALFLSKKQEFIDAFSKLCLNNDEFIDTIEASTKNITKYHARFSLFEEMINEVFGTSINAVPVPMRGE